MPQSGVCVYKGMSQTVADYPISYSQLIVVVFGVRLEGVHVIVTVNVRAVLISELSVRSVAFIV